MNRSLVAAWMVASGLFSARALGCAACFGASDSPMAHGMNWGIAVLLGVISTVLALVASFFVFVIRREKSVLDQEPVAPERPV
jgi:hypothetical protein